MNKFEGPYSGYDLIHYITDKQYLPKTKRTKREATPSNDSKVPNEIFSYDFDEIIARDGISIIVFADISSIISQRFFPLYAEIERAFSDVKVYTVDCLRGRNYILCFDVIINGLPLINFYRGGEKVTEDFLGSSFEDFKKEINKINKK